MFYEVVLKWFGVFPLSHNVMNNDSDNMFNQSRDNELK